MVLETSRTKVECKGTIHTHSYDEISFMKYIDP